jgi:hypothetical protein
VDSVEAFLLRPALLSCLQIANHSSTQVFFQADSPIPYDTPRQYQFIMNFIAAFICNVQAKSYQGDLFNPVAMTLRSSPPNRHAWQASIATSTDHKHVTTASSHRSIPFSVLGNTMNQYRTLTPFKSSFLPTVDFKLMAAMLTRVIGRR